MHPGDIPAQGFPQDDVLDDRGPAVARVLVGHQRRQPVAQLQLGPGLGGLFRQQFLPAGYHHPSEDVAAHVGGSG